jgi:hypothetical protein
VATRTDFEAEGLLDGVADERTRRARLDLLRTLEEEGFSLEELRRAVAEDRLVLLPLERVLEGEGRRYTPEEVAERTGLDVDFLAEARRAMGRRGRNRASGPSAARTWSWPLEPGGCSTPASAGRPFST